MVGKIELNSSPRKTKIQLPKNKFYTLYIRGEKCKPSTNLTAYIFDQVYFDLWPFNFYQMYFDDNMLKTIQVLNFKAVQQQLIFN